MKTRRNQTQSDAQGLQARHITNWLVPSYIKEVRVDFIKHIKNLRKYPKMTDKDWSNQ